MKDGDEGGDEGNGEVGSDFISIQKVPNIFSMN